MVWQIFVRRVCWSVTVDGGKQDIQLDVVGVCISYLFVFIVCEYVASSSMSCMHIGMHMRVCIYVYTCVRV